VERLEITHTQIHTARSVSQEGRQVELELQFMDYLTITHMESSRQDDPEDQGRRHFGTKKTSHLSTITNDGPHSIMNASNEL